MNIFKNPTEEEVKLSEKINGLRDQQDELKVHYYRPAGMELTEDDKKFDALESEIQVINDKLYGRS